MKTNELFKKAKNFIPSLEITINKHRLIFSKFGVARQYIFKIKTSLGSYLGLFTDSINHYIKNIQVNKDDILYSWITNARCYETLFDFNDFCKEFGYDFNNYDEYDKEYQEKNTQQLKLLGVAKKHIKKIEEIFTIEQKKKLQELFQDY